MQVIEIFQSIDGEGKRAGKPTTFIRLAGCNLRCKYCDSSYAFNMADGTTMAPADIVAKVKDIGVPSVTVTGGEPLVHPNIKDLLELLDDAGFDINVETNGTINPANYHYLHNVWFTVDYKCPSSGEENMMCTYSFETLREHDVLKFVVGSQEDLSCAADILRRYKPYSEVYFSPVFGYDPKNIVQFLLENQLYSCKVQLQLHKIIWSPDKRGV